MSSDDWPDWLPSDWFMQIRKIDGRKVKCFIDPEGHRCYSKPQVFDYLKKTQNGTGSTVDPDVPQTNEVNESTPQGRPKRLSTSSSSKKYNENESSLDEDGSPSEAIENPNWLPDGWTVELKSRKIGSSNGKKYKVYTDPISGRKFMSKPQVLSHLGKINGSAVVQREVSNLVEKYAAKADKSQKSEAAEIKENKTVKKTEGARLSSDYEVISRTPVDGLPEGWIKEIRMTKRGIVSRKHPYYIDPLSDYVFLSQKDVVRYLDSGDIRNCAMKPLKKDINKDHSPLTPTAPPKETATSEPLPNGSESGAQNKRPVRSVTGGSFSTPDSSARSITGGSFSKDGGTDWLPEGWTVEVSYKSSGLKFKIYQESATGKKFYSKPQVLSYLAGGGSSNSNSRKTRENKASDSSPNSEAAGVGVGRPKRSNKKKSATKNAEFKEEIITTPAEGLPPGWTKEIRTKIYATHKRSDPFYVDPETGYVFRSKVDAFRYLETGDVNLCAIRPKVKDKDGNEVFVYTHEVQKVKTVTKQPVFEDKEGENSTEKEQNDVPAPARGRSSSRIAKRTESRSTVTPARSSKRLKPDNNNISSSVGPTENTAVGENQGSGINLEEQAAADDGRLSYDIPEDDNWTDQCLDFAVKTLTNEILFNGQPASANFQEQNVGVGTSVNKTPPKANSGV